MIALEVIGSLAVAGLIVWLILRRAANSLKAMAPLVQRQNDVLRAVGRELGFAYAGTPDRYGELSGVRGGVNVVVTLPQFYRFFDLKIAVPGRKDQVAGAKKRFPSATVGRLGDNIFVMPQVPMRKVGSTRHRVILDAAELRRWIEDVASFFATS